MTSSMANGPVFFICLCFWTPLFYGLCLLIPLRFFLLYYLYTFLRLHSKTIEWSEHSTRTRNNHSSDMVYNFFFIMFQCSSCRQCVPTIYYILLLKYNTCTAIFYYTTLEKDLVRLVVAAVCVLFSNLFIFASFFSLYHIIYICFFFIFVLVVLVCFFFF